MSENTNESISTIQWLEARAEQIERDIVAFNPVAEKHGVDIIVAFRMTPEKREEFLNGTETTQDEIQSD